MTYFGLHIADIFVLGLYLLGMAAIGFWCAKKIKKSDDSLNIELERTVDILSEVKVPVKVGFAAESDDLESNALEKLSKKKLDLIVANDITAINSGFDADTNEVMIIDSNGEKEKLPLMAKIDVAHKILDKVAVLVSK